MQFPNIAVAGKLRAGKDEAARYLCEKYGYTRFAFGDELKRYANELFDVESGAKPRDLYQWLGQTMRERDSDIWVRKCFNAIERNNFWREYYAEEGDPDPEPPTRAVITDVRQPNEIIRCRSEGYVIIRVNAPESLRIHRAVESADTFNLRDLTHETECHTDLFTVDFDIYNVGTLADLHAQIDNVINSFRDRQAPRNPHV